MSVTEQQQESQQQNVYVIFIFDIPTYDTDVCYYE